MTSDGPLALVSRLAAILDELDISYALGGSVASSFFGEPRATADVDLAISVDEAAGEWRDVIGILLVSGDGLDLAYLRETALQVGLADLLDRAIDGSSRLT